MKIAFVTFSMVTAMALVGCSQQKKEEPCCAKASPDAAAPAAKAEPAWVNLFNGKDLTGWEQVGGSRWTVENGQLVGTQGEKFAPGDLLTSESFKDFELVVSYRVEWPANTGIWFRYQNAQKSYQADILEWPKPIAYSGTLYCPGKMFLAINADKSLENHTGWNTMRIRTQGDHTQIWLNDHQTADVHDTTTDSGRIGFQVHPGEQFGKMKIVIREARIRVLN